MNIKDLVKDAIININKKMIYKSDIEKYIKLTHEKEITAKRSVGNALRYLSYYNFIAKISSNVYTYTDKNAYTKYISIKCPLTFLIMFVFENNNDTFDGLSINIIQKKIKKSFDVEIDTTSISVTLINLVKKKKLAKLDRDRYMLRTDMLNIKAKQAEKADYMKSLGLPF